MGQLLSGLIHSFLPHNPAAPNPLPLPPEPNTQID